MIKRYYCRICLHAILAITIHVFQLFFVPCFIYSRSHVSAILTSWSSSIKALFANHCSYQCRSSRFLSCYHVDMWFVHKEAESEKITALQAVIDIGQQKYERLEELTTKLMEETWKPTWRSSKQSVISWTACRQNFRSSSWGAPLRPWIHERDDAGKH